VRWERKKTGDGDDNNASFLVSTPEMAHANPSQKLVYLFSQHAVGFHPSLGCTVRDAATSSDGNRDTLQDRVPTTQWAFVFFRTFRTQVLDLLSAHPRYDAVFLLRPWLLSAISKMRTWTPPTRHSQLAAVKEQRPSIPSA
jgi:hypothetical protein